MRVGRVLFSFGGGIDDVLSVNWLARNRGQQVVALLADLGQGSYLEPLGELALECGAARTIISDLRGEFLEDFVFPTIAAGARYEGYWLSTPLARSTICKELVRVCRELGFDAIGHGASPGGNDHLRFETAIGALDGEIELIGPSPDLVRLTLRERIERAEQLQVPLIPGYSDEVSTDRNLWGVGQFHGGLDDIWEAPPENLFQLTCCPTEAPAEPLDLMLTFESGLPIAVDDEPLDPIDLVEKLNLVGGEHGVGRLDHVENRVMGGKTREVYEAPAAALLYSAHEALEELTQPRVLNRHQRTLAEEYGRLIYEGQWFSQAREAIDAFFKVSQRNVSGKVRLRLFKGSITVRGRESDHALYCGSGDPLERLPAGVLERITHLQRAHQIRRRKR